MQLKRILLIVVLASLEVIRAEAQVGQAQGYAGVALFPSSRQQLLSGFRPGPAIGGGVTLPVRQKFAFNPNLEFTTATREHYTFSLLSIHNNFKYYLISSGHVRPYIMAVGNISFMNLHQQAYSTTVNPDASYYGTALPDIRVSQVVYREPDLKLQFAPTFGLGAGAGLDVAIKARWVPFVQYSFVTYFSRSSSLINDNFKNNTSNLSIQNIIAGVRYNIYQQ